MFHSCRFIHGHVSLSGCCEHKNAAAAYMHGHRNTPTPTAIIMYIHVRHTGRVGGPNAQIPPQTRPHARNERSAPPMRQGIHSQELSSLSSSYLVLVLPNMDSLRSSVALAKRSVPRCVPCVCRLCLPTVLSRSASTMKHAYALRVRTLPLHHDVQVGTA